MNRLKLNSTLASYISFACLGLFSFSLPAFAQEKEQFTIKNKTFSYEIAKETTAADLAAIEKEINAEKVATLQFSNVKRNEQNEIIGITTQFKDQRGSSQKKSEYNSQGIRPFSVKIHENAQGDKYLEITNDALPFASNSPASTTPFPDLFSDESTDSLMNQPDIMEMMRSMQESIQQQEEMIKQLFEK